MGWFCEGVGSHSRAVSAIRGSLYGEVCTSHAGQSFYFGRYFDVFN